jgi:hypothetical protein
LKEKGDGFATRLFFLDTVFLVWNTVCMAWTVEYTPEFEVWWDTLTEEEQDEIDPVVELLQDRGPTLARPHADVSTSSRHSNMEELRGKGGVRRLRVLCV